MQLLRTNFNGGLLAPPSSHQRWRRDVMFARCSL